MVRPRALVALALVQIVLAAGVLAYRWMTTSTEVRVDRAVERFRAERGADVDRDGVSSSSVVDAPQAAGATDGSTPAPAGPDAASQDGADATPAPSGLGFPIRAPDEGVYAWDTDGTESAGGLSRDLPERSVRFITHEGPTTWMNRHEYSEQHTEWFPLTITEQGVFSSSFRAKVSFGPITQDQTLTFDPPLRFAMFPAEVGQRWEGSMEGETRGSYTGRTFERRTLTIGGVQVDTWGIEIVMTFEDGDADGVVGRVLTRIWVAEQLRLTVREFYDQRITSGPGTYTGTWTITLRSLQPER